MFVQERAGLDGEGGLGLGLALVRRLAELHGGRVSVSSEGPGCGSCFEVRLPTTGTTERRTTLRNAPLVPTRGAHALHAVVVDDDDDLRELLQTLLTSFGHEVVTAVDGPTALALIRATTPDIALVDIGLPELDGYQLARTLRADAACSNTRLVAMTGRGTDADVADALAAGFDAHLVKPASIAAILEVLARWDANAALAGAGK